MIIGICGKLGAGKNLVATIIQYIMLGERMKKLDMEFFSEKTAFEVFCRWTEAERRRHSNWHQKSWAGKLKEVCALLTGEPLSQWEDQLFKASLMPEQWNRAVGMWPGEDAPMTYRLFMQLVGTDAMRNIVHRNVWVNALMADYRPIDPEKRASMGNAIDYSACTWPNWIITDTRFPNEVEAIKKVLKAFTIKVYRKDNPHPPSNHESELALDHYAPDYEIQNDGTIEDLIPQVEAILSHADLIP